MGPEIPVVHLITRLELGGAQLNTLATFQNLDCNLFSPLLMAGPGGILDSEVRDHPNVIWIRHLVRPIRPLRDLRCLLELIGHFRRIRPRIVHTHSSKAGILGRLAARWCRVEVIIHTVHGFPFSPHQFFLKRRVFVLLERLISRITTAFIFVSRADLQTARQKRLKIRRHQVIRSGFPLAPFREKSPSLLSVNRRLRLSSRSVVIGTIAPFKPQKGLFDLVEIAGRVLARRSDVIFLIAGDGPLKGRIEKILKRRRIDRYFRLPGFCRDIASLMDRFDIGLSTALWEGLPQSLVQMRLKKIPVVATDIPGNAEVIRDGLNGYLVKPRAYGIFADRLLELIGSKPLRRRLGEYREENFQPWDPAVMVSEQEDFYRRLLGKRENQP